MGKIKKMQMFADFSSRWFPKALNELNVHYQQTGCEGCHALLVEAKTKLGVKFGAEGGEKQI